MAVRFDRTHCEHSRTALLTPDQVRQIRAEYASGLRREDAPHVKYGVTWKCYYQAATYKSWRRLDDDAKKV